MTKTPGEMADELELIRGPANVILGCNMRLAYQALSPKEREFVLAHENLHRQFHGQPPLTDADFGIGNDNNG